MTDITLSLISHTNVGKTTLARTLLRRDVGEVLDKAHVTDVSEAHELIAAEGHRLLLWDTPGFGNSARLLARLKREQSPLAWLLHQVWDRIADRPLWCSQEAVRNVREHADLVLYLVNLAEDPSGAGYIAPELEILAWVGKPLLVLLNQTGPPSSESAKAERRWREALEGRPLVRAVLPLDAFGRCWVQEGLFLERVASELTNEQGAAMQALRRAWNARNLAVFETSLERMAGFLASTVLESESLPNAKPTRMAKRSAMEALAARLERREREVWDQVIAAHGLDGRAAVELVRRLDSFAVEGTSVLTAGKGALLGSVVSGAMGGLAADGIAGGLTLGGGLIAGALVGALGGAGLSRGFALVQVRAMPQVCWSAEFLCELAQRTALRYLAVAHFGRGRGPFSESEALEHWRAVLARVFESRSGLGELLRSPGQDEASFESRLRAELSAIVASVLLEAYPEAAELLP